MRRMVLLLAVFGLTLSLAGCSGVSKADVAPGASPSAIRSLRLGMSVSEVKAKLGPPVSTETDDHRVVLVYSKPVTGVRAYPMLWVRFDENDQLREVYAKRYFLWGVDDEAVYLLSEKSSPAWEADDFAECFPAPAAPTSTPKK